MAYYIYVTDEKLNGTGECISDGDINIEVSKEIHDAYDADPLLYIWNGTEIVENPNYEAEKQAKERAELDQLTLTPADVERALYKAKQMDFDDLKALIAQSLPQVDLKGLSIEFRAKDFYRGATANGIRLFDVVGQLLGYTTADMDYLFTHKELPAVEDINGSNGGGQGS